MGDDEKCASRCVMGDNERVIPRDAFSRVGGGGCDRWLLIDDEDGMDEVVAPLVDDFLKVAFGSLGDEHLELDCIKGLRFAYAICDSCLDDEFGGCCGDFGEEVVMKMDGIEMGSCMDHLDEVDFESHHS